MPAALLPAALLPVAAVRAPVSGAPLAVTLLPVAVVSGAQVSERLGPQLLAAQLRSESDSPEEARRSPWMPRDRCCRRLPVPARPSMAVVPSLQQAMVQWAVRPR